MASKKLYLKIDHEGKESSFELVAGKSVNIGRSPSCELKLLNEGVSQKHLKISWDGHEIFIQDLSSTNGSFRLPQDSPFAEASFSPQASSLTLRLAKETINIRWSDSEIVKKIDSTQVENVSKKTAVTLLSSRPTSPAKVSTIVSNLKKLSAITREIERPRRAKATPPLTGNLLLSSLLLLLCSLIWGLMHGKGLFLSSYSQLRLGGAIDLCLLWMNLIQTKFYLFTGSGLILGVSSYFIFKETHALRRRPLEFFFCENVIPTWLQKVATIIALLLALLWPFAIAKLVGMPLSKISPMLSFLKLFPERDNAKFEDEFRSAALSLKGSSLAYKQLLLHDRNRVLNECRANEANDSNWEDRRTCLILLMATSVEAEDEIKPALLSDVADRLSILLALDGITRVLSIEGLDSPVLKFFLNSLTNLGLANEEEDIRAILYSKNLSRDDAKEILMELRQRIEDRLLERQEELNLPEAFQISLKSPLEEGL